MCTAIRKEHLFGRNLDLDYDIHQEVILIGRDHLLEFIKEPEVTKHPAILGMGMVVNGYPLLSDAMNENGLAGAGLNFPNNAVFFPYKEGKRNVSPFELLPYVLSHFSSVKEVKDFFRDSNLLNIPFSEQLPLAPLHYIFADKAESIVVESTASGLSIYDNPYDVLTNNPPFPFHISNAKRYLSLTSEYPQNKIPMIDLVPDSVGFGSIGLPGDYSSASRFIKAFYLNKFLKLSHGVDKNIVTFINALNQISFLPGLTQDKIGKDELTIYSSCMDLNDFTYSYKRLYDRSITTIKPEEKQINSDQIITL